MINAVGIAAVGARHRDFRQIGFDGHHGFSVSSRFFGTLTHQSEHILDVLYIAFAKSLRAFIVVDIHVAVRQTDPTRINDRDDFGCILVVEERSEVEQRFGAARLCDLRPVAQAESVEVCDLARQPCFRGQCIDSRQLGL